LGSGKDVSRVGGEGSAVDEKITDVTDAVVALGCSCSARMTVELPPLAAREPEP